MAFRSPRNPPAMRACIKVDSSSVARRGNTPARQKSVTFDRIHVRSFPLVIGDHPFCTTGCPITLGWGHSKEEQMKIDEYESMRTKRIGGGSQQATRTSKDERRQLLSRFSEWDLQRGERNVYLDRRRRRRSQIARRFMAT